MNKHATSEDLTVYAGLGKDTIEAITSALLQNLDTRNFELARTDYGRLLATIRERGFQGKHIRYAAKKLNEFSKYAQKSGSGDAAKVAAGYASQLPKPEDTHKRLSYKDSRAINEIRHGDGGQMPVKGWSLDALLS